MISDTEINTSLFKDKVIEAAMIRDCRRHQNSLTQHRVHSRRYETHLHCHAISLMISSSAWPTVHRHHRPCHDRYLH